MIKKTEGCDAPSGEDTTSPRLLSFLLEKVFSFRILSEQKTDAFVDVNSVVWESGSGPRGLYQRACNDSPAHARLVQALKERGNSCIVEDFRVWLFQGRVYRRRLQETNLE